MGACLSKDEPVVVHKEPPAPKPALTTPEPAKQEELLKPALRVDESPGPPVSSENDWSKSWGKLNQTETVAVKETLLKVSELIEKFAEGNADREAPVHALKKALQLVASDCHASYASMSVVSTDQKNFLAMGAVGSSHEATTLPSVVCAVAASNSSVERIIQANLPSHGGSSSSSSATSASGASLSWNANSGAAPPSDWVQLHNAGIKHIHAMPIRSGPETLLGVLNLGFKHEPCLEMGIMGPHLFSTYLSLISATLTAVVRDPALNSYVCLARDLAGATTLDGIMQSALVGAKAALTRLKGSSGGAAGSHTWLRLALVSGDKSAAALYDDPTQAGVARASKRSTAAPSGSSASWVATIQAAGGLVRTNIPMKNTILRIALTNKKQVLIPDVQKLINQLGNVNTDLFASKLLRPPSSVLLLPLRASGVGIYGALYCLADVHTEFGEVAKQLKEVAELLGSGLNKQLGGALAAEYLAIQQLNHEQLLERDTGNESGTSLASGMGPGPAGHSSGIGGSAITGTVTPTTTAGSLTAGQHSYSTTSSSLTAGGAYVMRSEGSFLAAASGALEFGSTIGGSWTSSMAGSGGTGQSGPQGMLRSFTTKQVASSTNAVATGITEKLNQKRIDAVMSEPEDEKTLGALQLVAQIGEGGFAKVFRGLYRGLVVAVKVVAVGDPSNERAVMKNAHEIAILRSSSHPNIIQAYSCMTDVRIRDVVALCTRQAPRQQRAELITALTACAGGRGQQAAAAVPTPDDATCHIEVVEYCDLGNLTSAIRNQIFTLPARGAPAMHQSRSRGQLSQGQRSCNASIASTTDDEDYNSSCCTDDSSVGAHSGSAGAPAAAAALPLQGRLRVNMRWLLLTLLEVAEGMAYLHRMGVVHCDMKPANVLLKSSNADIRGFSAKVSDFGLSRVEDDDTCATFPFNSCGTAAYVAPEALITTKKVNASVDVYAFGVMMWELFVGQRPYGNMSQQKVVEEVVLRGLRPSFPVGTPPRYSQLAAACWHATAGARPAFQEVIGRLQAMLHEAEESEVAAAASCSLNGSEAWGGRADGLAMSTAAAAAAMAAATGSAAGNIHPQQQQLLLHQQQQQQQQQRVAATLQPGPRVATSEAAAAAAAAIAEAAAAWNKQQANRTAAEASAIDSNRLAAAMAAAAAADAAAAARSGGNGSASGLRPGQQAQQLMLQWQQQQQQGSVGAGDAGGPAGTTAGGMMGVAGSSQRHSQRPAMAASGSVYEYQQVGFRGDSVVGTGAVGSGRYNSNSSSSSNKQAMLAQIPPRPGSSGSGLSQQQQMLLAAAAAAGYGGVQDHMGVHVAGGGHVRRPPTKSKTFTAGTPQQQYEQLVAAAAAVAAANREKSASSCEAGNTGGSSATSGTSLSFKCTGTSADAGLQQSLLQQQQQQQLLLRNGGYMAAVGLLSGHQQPQQGSNFSFQSQPSSTPGAHQFALGGSSTAAAAAALAAQQQRQQQELAAARDLLARHLQAAARQQQQQ